ncbi:MAG: histidine kinase dimerization/phospho-acceptor domain-containing protein [Armatimonadota bacterium]
MKMFVDARQHCLHEYAELATQLDHDVRSPLTAICTYSECLEQVSSTDCERRERYGRAIRSEARRLGRLCADFAALAAPPPDERLREIDVHEAVRMALEELKELSDFLEVTVEVGQFRGPLIVFWPAIALRHLLTATLESVFMSVVQGSRVVIAAHAEARDVALSISALGKKALPCDPDRLSFRAAARLVGTRGGSLMLLNAEEPQVRLNLPFSGRLSESPAPAPLERSA